MVRATFFTIILFILLGGCLFGAAGNLSWPMAWAFLGIYFSSKVSALVFVDQELIKERAAPGLGVDRVDQVLVTLGYLGLYPATLVVAGLDAVRLGPAIHIPNTIKLAGLFVFAIGYCISFWAVLCNPFFSTFVRIQDDRDHSVVSSGAYALVRHPGYASVLLSHLALPIMLGSIWAVVPAFIGTIFFVLRTAREDRTLREYLVGYREYQARVRWRLLPGVW